MTLDEIHAAVVEVEREIPALAPAAPGVSDVMGRIRMLQGELERTRGVLGPLVPDAASPKSPDEQRADDLAAALGSLLQAADAKREPSAL
jgi:hypothetical protein